MRIELYCPSCSLGFAADPEASPEELREQMFQQGPRYCEGATLEDMIFHTLRASGFMHCPECSQAVDVMEESLGRMALAMLACW